ncbi:MULTISPECIES: hypothetical protein [unclassified Olleya]|jgi:hypothetical protein|uniref:hypothetical protein n=1 Tax=unclassified Olleya TaxID=2615019 RepID=UPI0011A4A665|nr:hypothetical protein [Olleya sp. Hel_I_94]TVZ46229.1 hypothetical protein JM82_0798 [Olleya sp. Hel_I_94]
MKYSFKLFFLLITSIALLSCNNNDDASNVNNTTTNPIIGDWLREDATDSFEYHIHFESENFGKIVTMVITEDNVISSANPFEWTIHNEILTIIDNEDFEHNTTVEYTDEGHLKIEGFSDLEFTKQ